jgi:hypothetical protein
MRAILAISMSVLLAACAGVTSQASTEAAVPQPEPRSADVPAPTPAEPVLLELPGWTLTDVLDFESERILRFQDGDTKVELVRWWGYPELEGGPMAVAQASTVQVSGKEVELVRTTMFEGETAEVDVIHLRSDGWLARVSCEGCTQEQLDTVVAGLSVRW